MCLHLSVTLLSDDLQIHLSNYNYKNIIDMNVTLSLVTAPDRFNAEFLRVPNENVKESHEDGL